MMRLLLGVAVGVVVVAGVFILLPHFQPAQAPTEFAASPPPTALSVSPVPPLAQTPSVVLPAAGFLEHVTKKPFGLLVTPQNSPIQPERFSGYHTGADAELPADTPIVAIADGVVRRSGSVSGYGGLVVVEHTIDGQKLFGIYGHLDPQALPSADTTVSAGSALGHLGAAFSNETDGERAHLHFGLYVGPDVNIRGYVSEASALSAWYDPVAFFTARGILPAVVERPLGD